MLYQINNKFYVKVQGYYKEVDIKLNGDNLDITPNGNEIEVYNVQDNVYAFDTRTNKEQLINTLRQEDRNENTNDEHELLGSMTPRRNNRSKRL